MTSPEIQMNSSCAHYFVELGGNVSAKIDFLLNFLEEHLGSKVGIFCPFPSDVDFLEAVLRRKGLLLAKLIGHVPYAKVAAVLEQLASMDVVGVLLTDISAKHINLGEFDYLIIYGPSADPNIYYQRSGIASGTTPRIATISLVSTQDAINFQYLRKALNNVAFEPFQLTDAKILENRKILIKKLIEKSANTNVIDDRVKFFAEYVMGERGLLQQGLPLFIDSFIKSLPAESDRYNMEKNQTSNLPAPEKVSLREARLFINLGSNHGFSESALKALLDEVLENGGSNFIRVSIRKDYSFFDVSDLVSEELQNKLDGVNWNGNKMFVRIAMRLNPLRSQVVAA
jgi:superfamily II DNA/RNA helicase